MDNLQLDPDFTYETYQPGGEAFVSQTVGAGTAITSFNGLSGPSVLLAGGSTGYSFSPSGTTLTMTGAAASIKETAGPTTLTIGAVADGQYLVRSGASVVGASVVTPALSVVTKTAAYTLTDADDVILVDATSGAVTITLHAVATAKRKPYYFKKIDAGGNAMVLEPDGAETVDGAANISVTVQYTAYTLFPTSSGWVIL
jgi:hypothetical protein